VYAVDATGHPGVDAAIHANASSPRFAAKKARPGTWQERCGDNIYFRDGDGRWTQARAFFHTHPTDLEKDTRHPRVFISDHFFYFGENAPSIPDRYSALVRTRQGCCCSHDATTVRSFVAWLGMTYRAGVHGNPRSRADDATVGLAHIRQRNAPARPTPQLSRLAGSRCSPSGRWRYVGRADFERTCGRRFQSLMPRYCESLTMARSTHFPRIEQLLDLRSS
jgi:hypothetical protein